VETHSADLRILAVVPSDRRTEIARQLAPIKAELLFVRRSAEAAVAIREGDVFQVALLPASLCDTDWWELWGVLALLNRRPAILVYTRKATFQLWSGVLDLGGYDVIVEPFSDEELQGAVLRAAKSFEEQHQTTLRRDHSRCRDRCWLQKQQMEESWT
jgi:DNA-binding NtrC family response regulator